MGAGIGEVFKTVKILLVQRLSQLLVEVEVNNTFNTFLSNAPILYSLKNLMVNLWFSVFFQRGWGIK